MYSLYFKYSLIVALVIYDFLYLFSIETTDATGAPAGAFIILGELIWALFLLIPSNFIAMALILFSVSIFGSITKIVKNIIAQNFINITIVITSHFLLYFLFKAIK